MATIYSPPDGVAVPEYKFGDPLQEYRKKQDEFIETVAAFCKNRNPNKEHVGKVIRFPHADGYAIYMVASLRPVELIHLPLGDAWEYPYVHRLSMSDVLEEINRQEALERIFSKKDK